MSTKTPPDAYRVKLLQLQADYSAWTADECPSDARLAAAENIGRAFPDLCEIALAAIEWRLAYEQRSIGRMKDANLGLRLAVDQVAGRIDRHND